MEAEFKTKCIGKSLENSGVYCGCPDCNPMPKITEQEKAEQDRIRAEQIAEQERKDKIKQEHILKVGDLFETSWGYDQTNYDYLAVVGISPSGKTAICQMTSCETINDNEQSPQAYKQKPIYKPYGKTFKMRIRKGDLNSEHSFLKETTLRGSYYFCNDSKRLDTFSLVLPDDVFFETNTQFGH